MRQKRLAVILDAGVRHGSAPGTRPRSQCHAGPGTIGLDRPTRRRIQQDLKNEGFDPVAPAGRFGPHTRAAIPGVAGGARRVMNEVLAVLPAEVYFKYAPVAVAASPAETAVASVNEVPAHGSRHGEFYQDALGLLDSAEEAELVPNGSTWLTSSFTRNHRIPCH